MKVYNNKIEKPYTLRHPPHTNSQAYTNFTNIPIPQKHMDNHLKPFIESGNEDHLHLLKSMFSDDSQDQRKIALDLTLQ